MTNTTEAKDEPPYLRIAREIRRRVEEGELAPGERVPSTRGIAKEWGVALATATKALTHLRLEGTVETKPRVGTVVAAGPGTTSRGRRTPPSGTPTVPPSVRPDDQELTLDRIVRTAIDIADTEGLQALSMRGVAARLGVAAMSPYRYVTGKDDLILRMADTAFGEQTYPATPPDGWRARLELGARTLWSLHRLHPWLAQLSSLTRPLLLPNLLVHGEWSLSALDGHGLDTTELFDIHVLLFSHVQGLAVHLEREAQAEAATGQSEDQWMDSHAHTLQGLVDSGRFPTFTKVVGSFHDGYDLRLDALFERGLEALLDGLAPVIESGGRPRG
ncbi:TetR/AcrR family transcriptional regulator C-terminal domain-containing protein [Streptomyces sp. ME01-18a]|uniref:TetR/AcrR family transcriptional regulator C-terminal domain-containing protein n=1 Tax=unclassified Streptomyces TaxID=2593676 RepID=UPI0029BED0DC|nr:TetR/AcrR family transcriptional regulator C-terminal domain-containing protein [Streptomyces sp. ME01-18a]MDX3431995.1 TetR/AcrR family transcriptional regulator C-terminal domain-containing protein [Streptomyces sp. ME01-18a]